MYICSSLNLLLYVSVTRYTCSQIGIEYSPADNEILESSNVKNFTFSVLQAATENFKMNSTIFRDSTGCMFRGRIENHSLTASNPEMVKVILVKQFWGFGFITCKEFLVRESFFTLFQEIAHR